MDVDDGEAGQAVRRSADGVEASPSSDGVDGPDGLVELVVGKPAAGGGCVARVPDGRVAFVRHAIPGERVLARVTEATRSFVRADAVVIAEPSPERVRPPCPYAGPGRCGGCDWQHVSLPQQRLMKAALVTEQLQRLAAVEWDVTVEPVSDDENGLAWRTRVRYSVLPKGRLGFRRYRSHDIVPVDRCAVASPRIAALAPERSSWRGADEVEVVAPEGSEEILALVRSRRGARLSIPPFDGGLVVDGRTVREPGELDVAVLGHRFSLSGGVFWQAHAGAASLLGRVVLDLASPVAGAEVADLYAGAGLFSAVIAGAVGPSGHVLAVEQDARAASDARRNLAAFPCVDVLAARVTPELVARQLRGADLVVLDPPRQGAGLQVVAALESLPQLRRIVYVACDAASFARDLRRLLDAGWALAELRAFDLFPMTEHVELVALVEKL